MDQFVLGQMQGHLTLNEIATRVLQMFSERFVSEEEALHHVQGLSAKYSR